MRPARTAMNFLMLFVALAVLAAGINKVQGRMNEIRLSHKLVNTDPLEKTPSTPPIVTFTVVALGGFRGLVADWLWLRSNRMQEKNSLFEMVQLASWIVKLQPRFTGAAAHLAWNMAYNISVTFTSFEDRWRWVQQGIELLRDEALLYNPNDPVLFSELGWIYQHKLGQIMDDANLYYKTQMAIEYMTVLGGYPVDWEKLAQSPKDQDQLAAALGENSALWAILAEEDTGLDKLERVFRQRGSLPETMAERLRKAKLEIVVDRYFRARWLRLRYRLDPEWIIKLNKEYGDLDWRLPQAHAIYWARRGLEVADEGIALKCDRMVFQSLNAAFKTGRILFLKGGDVNLMESPPQMTPNIEVVDATNQAYLDAMQKHPDNSGIKGGYENFLIDATVILYSFGKRDKAMAYLKMARDMYKNPKFDRDLDSFVLDELAKDIASATQAQAQAAVQAYLLQFCEALAYGDQDRALVAERIAYRIWDKYGKDVDYSDERSVMRRGLPPYEQMRRTTIQLAFSQFPDVAVASLRGALNEIGGEFAEIAKEYDKQQQRTLPLSPPAPGT